MMNMSGSGGVILHTIKVYAFLMAEGFGTLMPLFFSHDDPKASSVMAHRLKAKKARLEAAASAGDDPAAESSETATVPTHSSAPTTGDTQAAPADNTDAAT